MTTETRHPGTVSVWLRKTIQAAAAFLAGQPFTVDMPCGPCTACCKGYEVEVSPGDDPRLDSVPGDRYPRSLPRTADGTCANLVEGVCQVYAWRPKSCRIYDCRGMFFAQTRCKRDDIQAAVEQWSPERIIKTREDAHALAEIAAARPLAVELVQQMQRNKGVDGVVEMERVIETLVILIGIKRGVIRDEEKK
jgi:Fe-S-cluster containining protein